MKNENRYFRKNVEQIIYPNTKTEALKTVNLIYEKNGSPYYFYVFSDAGEGANEFGAKLEF